MTKYVKQEMNDLNGSGKKRAYYRLETIRNLSGDEFIEPTILCCEVRFLP